jgi:hypothetical protein
MISLFIILFLGFGTIFLFRENLIKVDFGEFFLMVVGIGLFELMIIYRLLFW